MDAVQKAQPKNLQALAQSVDQIEKDLSSIRSMVLNRGNFTAPPPVAFKIPEWQKKSGSILNGISSSNDVYTPSVVSNSNVVLENSTVSIDSTVPQSPLELELKAVDTISPVSQSDISDCSAEVTCAASCNSSPLIVTENETQKTKTCSSVPSCENSILLPDIENSSLPGLLTSADESSDGS
ncbi:uncharacterized protein LOC108666641 [Hyalella azteca]|uniref:Uncharacterized protein LOC108666641 n=1 Tax=Hyalella azteca TaxID=294128 RepID=A0A8B7N5B5_HYAAZ|nr:uncharacterized protein LOC108666641 [Hyalella azteca]